MGLPDSLRGRLILGAGLWVALALAVGGLLLAEAFRDSAERAFRLRLEAHLRSLLAVVESSEDGRAVVGRPAGEPRFEQPYSGWYWQVSEPDGTAIRSRSLWDSALPVSILGDPGSVTARREPGPRGQMLEVLERDLLLGEGGHRLHVLVAADRAELEEEVARFRRLLALSLGILGLGLLAGATAAVRFALRPLRRLEDELDALTRGSERLGGTWPREVTPLVEAVNRVLDHDSHLVAHARARLGDLAHALKTPLAVLRTECRDTPAAAPEIERLSRLIDRHLARARAEADSARRLGRRTPIAPLAEQLATALRRVHAERGLTLNIGCPPDADLPGGPDEAAEMLGNLMDNACKWARSTVRVTAGRGWVLVEDDGPGLEPEQAAAATRRGLRLDESVPGSGLGLAIVADLAALEGLAPEFGVSALGGLAAGLREMGKAAPPVG